MAEGGRARRGPRVAPEGKGGAAAAGGEGRGGEGAALAVIRVGECSVSPWASYDVLPCPWL